MLFIGFWKFFPNGMKFGFVFLVFDWARLLDGKSSFSLVMCQCLRNVCMVERCVRFFVFERPVGALHADAANRISPGACISIDYRSIIYLSIYLSFDLSMCIFCISKKIGRSVRLLHCYMSGGMSALVVCFACLSASFFLLLSVSCSRTWWALLFLFCAFFQNSISALAGVLLSLCYLCYLMLSLCYLCAIYAISGGGQCFDLCYLCAISVLSMLSHARESFLLCAISVLSLCYLCYLCAISVLSLWYLLNISLKSVVFTQTDAEDAAHPEGHAPQSRLAGVRGDWRSSHALVLIVHMQWAFVKETMHGNGFAISCICVSTDKRTIFISYQYNELILAVCPPNEIYRKRCDRYEDKYIFI